MTPAVSEEMLAQLKKMHSEMVAEGVNGWPVTVSAVIDALSALPLPVEGVERTWEVSVAVNGNNILTIGSNHLSGIENIDEFAEIVANCGEHLLSFIGRATPAAEAAQPVAETLAWVGMRDGKRWYMLFPPKDRSEWDEVLELVPRLSQPQGELREALEKIAELQEVKYGSEDYGWEPLYSQKAMLKIAQAALAGRTAG
jgi:hypothetical protein